MKRYIHVIDAKLGASVMLESPDGGWILYEDFRKIVDALKDCPDLLDEISRVIQLDNVCVRE